MWNPSSVVPSFLTLFVGGKDKEESYPKCFKRKEEAQERMRRWESGVPTQGPPMDAHAYKEEGL